jgi:hypothetical protein
MLIISFYYKFCQPEIIRLLYTLHGVLYASPQRLELIMGNQLCGAMWWTSATGSGCVVIVLYEELYGARLGYYYLAFCGEVFFQRTVIREKKSVQSLRTARFIAIFSVC